MQGTDPNKLEEEASTGESTALCIIGCAHPDKNILEDGIVVWAADALLF